MIFDLCYKSPAASAGLWPEASFDDRRRNRSTIPFAATALAFYRTGW